MENTNEAKVQFANKFSSVEELEKSYLELQSKLGQQGKTLETPEDAAPTETPPEEPQTTETPKQDAEAIYGEGLVSALSGAGLDVNDIAKEYEEKGEVTGESRVKLDQLFGKAVVDNYFAGIQAQTQANQGQADAEVQEIYQIAGGEENYQKVVDWAMNNPDSSNLIDRFNQSVDGQNVDGMKLNLMLMKQQYESKHGTISPASVKAGASPSNSGRADGFGSTTEMTKAIQDPRYAYDPVYREEVARRIAASSMISG